MKTHKTATGKKFCSECGFRLNKGAKYCSNCSASTSGESLDKKDSSGSIKPELAVGMTTEELLKNLGEPKEKGANYWEYEGSKYVTFNAAGLVSDFRGFAASEINSEPREGAVSYEYKTVFYADSELLLDSITKGKSLDSRLNDLGSVGWEVISQRRALQSYPTEEWGVEISLKRKR